MLKFDHERRADVDLERSDFRAHYENVAVRRFLAMSLWIRRHWRISRNGCHARTGAGFPFVATAASQIFGDGLVYPNYSRERRKKCGSGNVEATAIVAGEARLMLSDTIVQAVVKRLALAPVDAK